MLKGKGGLLRSRTMKTVAKEEEQRDEGTMKERKKERDRQKRRHASFLKLMCEIWTDRMAGLVLLCVDLK